MNGTAIEIGLFIDDDGDPVSTNTTYGLSNNTFKYLHLHWIAEIGNHSLNVKVDYSQPNIPESNESNNENETFINILEGDPKIIINQTDIADEIRWGELTYINVTVQNIRGNSSATISAELNIEEEELTQTKSKTGGLARNETYNFSFEWTPTYFGDHNITIKAKHAGDIHDQTDPIICFIEPYKLPWWNENWHYRKLMGLYGNGSYSQHVNFTEMLEELQLFSKTFENDTIRIVEYAANGQIVNDSIDYNFSESDNFNNISNATGLLTWKVSDPSESQIEKYFFIYFDVKENNESTRNPLVETENMTSSDFNITYNGSVEGWWSEIENPTSGYYSLNATLSIEVYTTAKSKNVTADLYRGGSLEDTIYLESNNNIDWLKNYNFTKEGNWTFNVNASDQAGFHPDDVQSDKFMIVAMPDLGVVEVTVPSDEVTEGEPVEVHAVLNNTGDADAENYEVRLYLTQGALNWESSQFKNSTTVSIDINESVDAFLTWYPALYGDPEKNGNWTVGIWIYTNSTYRDSNTLNNKGTNSSLRIVGGEKNPPSLEIFEITDPQEKGKPVTIVAIALDESGIKEVNITITDPDENTTYSGIMTEQENNKYRFEFEETQIIGEYNFSINAVDNSFYHNESTIHGVFEIIEDATSPSINYFGAYPSIQLKGGYVNISCISTDIVGVQSVQVKITYPDNQTVTKNMTNSYSNKYIYSHSYEILGKYEFYIIAEDIYGNNAESETKEFWITTDLDDTDSDGMPDWWEERYGFDPYDPTDADQDEDDDGYTNVEEYKSDTNPLKAPSLTQKISNALKENWKYLVISIILFVLIVVLSLYGLRRLKT